jgi:hypothetical protein
MSSIKITQAEWDKIFQQIKNEYPSSVTMIRSKMKSQLGFVLRKHHFWNYDSGRQEIQLYLDFFDEQLLTFFKLKYFNV